MFVKLIVLILALGSTGIGVLSVRQSRLVASNEMTQSRLRARVLDQKSMELRMQIAQSVTPDQIRAMLGQEIDSVMVDQTQRRIDLFDPVDFESSVDDTNDAQVQVQAQVQAQVQVQVQADPIQAEPHYWTLDDGTRVYVLDDEIQQ